MIADSTSDVWLFTKETGYTWDMGVVAGPCQFTSLPVPWSRVLVRPSKSLIILEPDVGRRKKFHIKILLANTFILVYNMNIKSLLPHF